MLAATGCAAPRWDTISDRTPDDAINSKHLKRLLTVVVRSAVDYEAGLGPYELLLPAGTAAATYAEVTRGLGPDARPVPGVPAVALRDDGRADPQSAEAAGPPEAMTLSPSGDLPLVEVREIRLRGQTGRVDVVRPLRTGRHLLEVTVDLDPGFGWRAADVKRWTFDPGPVR